ncbi:mismatch-specific DNA-glycosylase [Reyranella sp.]|uniref:mismatch-specific DNA-glycosylase n=1 Tax=Reyranella sp. TaxID=1929291 RepID=UPI001209A533|nr:mismatch-specific DNA-glycosylase [Reyranella sp.]TAJ83597.1 MAG: mismatch-specific DNA-glycosylase [Reyranella sp.]
MPRASSRNKQLIPDLLAPGLDLVFCGTAPSPISFKARAYYANPGNAFWPTLYAIGLTPERLAPQQFPELLGFGIGLTDLNKTEVGSDHELTPAAMDAASLHSKLRQFRPAAIAFTSKNAAALGLGVKAPGYGRQQMLLEGAVVFVLASPSGRARSFWTLAPWREAAAFVAERRRLRERAA